MYSARMRYSREMRVAIAFGMAIVLFFFSTVASKHSSVGRLSIAIVHADDGEGLGSAPTNTNGVTGSLKPFCTISTNPRIVENGDSIIISWTSGNTTSASINGNDVELNGSHTVMGITSATTYTMTVTGPHGSAQCQTMVTVKTTACAYDKNASGTCLVPAPTCQHGTDKHEHCNPPPTDSYYSGYPGYRGYYKYSY